MALVSLIVPNVITILSQKYPLIGILWGKQKKVNYQSIQHQS